MPKLGIQGESPNAALIDLLDSLGAVRDLRRLIRRHYTARLQGKVTTLRPAASASVYLPCRF
jgi:hypothetical protein